MALQNGHREQGGLRTLIADDVADLRVLLRTLLELDGGFDVVGEAGDGHEAVRLAGAHRPDVVLLDLAMPVLDGLSAIPLIRERSPGSRIVVVSGFAGEQNRRAALDQGADAYVVKGLDVGALVGQIREVLGLSGVGGPLPGEPPDIPWPGSADRLSRILADASAGVAIADSRGCLLHVNRGLGQLLGRPEAELRGRPLAEFTHPDDAAEEEKLFGAVLAGERGSYHLQKRMRRGDGTDVRVGTLVLGVPRARPRYALVLAGEAAAEEAVHAAPEAQRDLVATVSHELGAPAAVIAGFAEVLALSPSLRPVDRRAVEAIERQSRRLARLIDDLLAAAGGEEGRLAVEPEPCRAGDVVAAALADLGPGAGPVALEGDLDAAVLADPRRLEQILVNFLTNALRHGAPPVSVDVSLRGGRVEVRVRDQGPGVPDEFVPRLFQRFSRHRSAPAGSGLGLYVCRQLAEAQGGAVWYERGGQGTAFAVALPAAEGEGSGP